MENRNIAAHTLIPGDRIMILPVSGLGTEYTVQKVAKDARITSLTLTTRDGGTFEGVAMPHCRRTERPTITTARP